MTPISKIIKDYTLRIVSFRPDESFEPLAVADSSSKHWALAASGKTKVRSEYQRIGVLANPAQTIIVRIFHHPDTGEYRLFFLGQPGSNLDGAVVSTYQTFKYFVVDESHYVTIPAEAGIDPTKDKLILTLPDQHYRLPIAIQKDSEWTGSVTEQETTVSFRAYMEQSPVENTTELVQLNGILHIKSRDFTPGKVLYSQGSFKRIVPLVNGGAAFFLPDDLPDSIDLYFYE